MYIFFLYSLKYMYIKMYGMAKPIPTKVNIVILIIALLFIKNNINIDRNGVEQLDPNMTSIKLELKF
ncbi:MAG: hypothetical protein AAFO15_02145 [Pseudomonadota bacterium]